MLLQIADTYGIAGFRNGEEFIYRLCRLSLNHLSDSSQREKAGELLDSLEAHIQTRDKMIAGSSPPRRTARDHLIELHAVKTLFRLAAVQVVANLMDTSFNGEFYTFLSKEEISRIFPEIDLNIQGFKLDWTVIVEGAMIDIEAVPENEDTRSFLLTFDKGFVSLFGGYFSGQRVDPEDPRTTRPDLNKWFPEEKPDGESALSHPRRFIPSIEAHTTALRFFECGHDVLPLEKRIYGETFAKSSSRYIWWELTLAHPASGRRIDFSIESVYHRPDQSRMDRQVQQTYFLPDWETSIHQQGRGMRTPGNWAPGIYRVELYIEGLEVAGGFFEIVQDEKQHIPSLNAWVDRLMFFESGGGAVPDGLWVFNERFSRKKCRHINWHLSLDHPDANLPREFKITAVWYLPNDTEWTRQSTETRFGAGSISSWHTAGRGWDVEGQWMPGTYRLDLFIEGRKVAAGVFEIIE